MPENPYANLSQLGQIVPAPANPEEAVLETFPNPHPGTEYVVRLTSPEFTTLCPLTAQPDFATLIVDYVPGERLVESKSFKIFLGSFRNHGTFHEACTVYVHNRLRDALAPRFLRVVGLWNPRGGIPIDVTVQSGTLPDSCQPLPLGGTAYRGGRE